MKKSRNILSIFLLSVFWLGLFCLLQLLFNYNFYAAEGKSLFLFNTTYLFEEFVQPGGTALLISKFLIQFYAFHFAGAALTATVLIVICIQIMDIIKRTTSHVYILLYSLPAVLLFFSLLDLNYHLHGVIAISMLLGVFQLYIRLNGLRAKLIYTLIATPTLFFLAGSVSFLLAILVLFRECLDDRRRCIWFVIPVLESFIIASGSVFLSVVGEFRFAFLPDMYYHQLIDSPPPILYYTWLSIPLVFILAWLLRKRKDVKGKRTLVENSVQLVLILVIYWIGTPKYGDLRFMKFREIDYNFRQERWDKVIDLCNEKIDNYLYLMNLNMALANKGMLADRMFHFDQKGPQGLFLDRNSDYSILVLLSDYYFTTGNMAGALHTAFEANITSNNESPRMIKRLIQAYLVYGNYPVAERYIKMLEETLCYREWAKNHRRFLYNEHEIENDSVLGWKRKTMVRNNFLYTVMGNEFILAETAMQHPSDKTSMEYLGAFYLLAKDLAGFKYFIQQFYGTDILPSLPVSFQEAVLILYASSPEEWRNYKISNQSIVRFRAYQRAFLAAQHNPGVRALLASDYKDTYWYYFMFK